MAANILLLGLAVWLTYCSIAFTASSQNLLQDFCIADLNSPVLVNGFACKDPKLVEAKDFTISGLHIRGNTSNPFGAKANRVTVTQAPVLNFLGVSIVRADFAPGGINPPHYHPRASEIQIVMEGTLLFGLVTSNPENRLMTKVLNKGDAFVHPAGLVHFQKNIGLVDAVTISAISSENPGVNYIADSVFGSKPSIPVDILAKAFQVDENFIHQTQNKFSKG